VLVYQAIGSPVLTAGHVTRDLPSVPIGNRGVNRLLHASKSSVLAVHAFRLDPGGSNCGVVSADALSPTLPCSAHPKGHAGFAPGTPASGSCRAGTRPRSNRQGAAEQPPFFQSRVPGSVLNAPNPSGTSDNEEDDFESVLQKPASSSRPQPCRPPASRSLGRTRPCAEVAADLALLGTPGP